jgi:hypothetical protein
LIRAGRLVVISGLLAACSGLPFGPEKTFSNGTEALPGPGYFHVNGDPELADERLVIRNFGPDGQEAARTETFEAGERVVFDGAALIGPRGLSVNGVKCDGTFPLAQDRETDVVLQVSGDGCAVTAVNVHLPGEPSHEE